MSKTPVKRGRPAGMRARQLEVEANAFGASRRPQGHRDCHTDRFGRYS